jgi:hypothetical protein
MHGWRKKKKRGNKQEIKQVGFLIDMKRFA